MADLPLVTIVTPSLNQGEFLEETILSVLEQDYPNIEYMVFDGGSTDHSLEVLQRYSNRMSYWESTPDRGQSHAVNKGLQRSRGDILGWLNSDDRLLPGTVRRVVETIAQYREIDVVYGKLLRIDSQGRRVPTPILPKDRVVFDSNHAIGECVINQPGSFWRRRVMEKAGFLNEDLHYSMDYEYWVRILEVGGKFFRLPEPLAEFRLSSGSKTVGQATRAAQEQLRVIDQLVEQPGLAGRLGIKPEDLARQAREGRGVISLYAFYGYFKDRQWSEAVDWLIRAHRSDPFVLFNRRWIDLALAGLIRRSNLS